MATVDELLKFSRWLQSIGDQVKTDPKGAAIDYARGAAGGVADLADFVRGGTIPISNVQPLGWGDSLRKALGATGSATEDAGNLLGVPTPTGAAMKAGVLAKGWGAPLVTALGAIKDVGKAGEAAGLTAEGLNKATRAKRRVGTSGQYVGAPPGVDSPAKFNVLIDQYAQRIDEALNNGVPRGYFYERGTAANRAVTDSAQDANRLAMVEGITSSEAPVLTNTGWGIKAIEQKAMGAPINTGKYPNANRAKVERVLNDDFAHIGEKTHRYAAGLAGDKKGLAPNDRWEIRSFGYTTDTAKPQQHAFMDEVRKRAVERWNAKHPDQTPLEILEGQELNWATQRARDMKIPHAQAAADTIQDALRGHVVQHSWESRGGEKAKHLQEMPKEEWPAWHEQVKNVLLDEQGKDKLVRGVGAQLQFPAVNVPGFYDGVVSPGAQSRSIGYMTQSGGLDPVTEARVRGTEALRAYMLGQDAYAYHGLTHPANISGPKTDTFDIKLGRTPTEAEMQTLGDLMGAKLGAAGPVGTETGVRALRFNKDPAFAKKFRQDVAPQLSPIFGGIPEVRAGARFGDAPDLGWQGRTATIDMLKELGNPAAPKMIENADSPEVRALAGQMADLYDAQRAAGRQPADRLTEALREFATNGLAGLGDLVAKGLAPAVGGFGLSQLFDRLREERQSYQ